MAFENYPTECPLCGGAMGPVRKAGRTSSYRGEQGFLLPADLDLWTCDTCGEELTGMNGEAEAMEAALEPQWRKRLR